MLHSNLVPFLISLSPCTSIRVGNPRQDDTLLIIQQATLRFSPTGRIRTTRKLPLPLRHTLPSEPPALPKIKLQFQPPKLRADSSSSSLTSASSSNPNWPVPPGPRRILKPPKRPSVVSMVGPAVSSSLDGRLMPTGENIEQEKEVVRPKLTLKLNLKGAGAGRAKQQQQQQ